MAATWPHAAHHCYQKGEQLLIDTSQPIAHRPCVFTDDKHEPRYIVIFVPRYRGTQGLRYDAFSVDWKFSSKISNNGCLLSITAVPRVENKVDLSPS